MKQKRSAMQTLKGLDKLNAILAQPDAAGSLRYGKINFYVRNPAQFMIDGVVQTAVLQLATIDADKPGKGALTSLLPQIEDAARQAGSNWIYVENVIHERFGLYWERQGYQRVNRHLEGNKFPWSPPNAKPRALNYAKQMNISN